MAKAAKKVNGSQPAETKAAQVPSQAPAKPASEPVMGKTSEPKPLVPESSTAAVTPPTPTITPSTPANSLFATEENPHYGPEEHKHKY